MAVFAEPLRPTLAAFFAWLGRLFVVSPVMPLPVDTHLASVAPSPSPLPVSAGGVRLFTGSSLVWANQGLNRRRLTKLPRPG
jgi:hypothetical protein